MSLRELLEGITNLYFNIEKIRFQLTCFDVKDQNQKLNQSALKNLAMHLAPSHGSAVGLRKNNQSDVGHAISMYKYCRKEESFCYKDSSAEAYFKPGTGTKKELKIYRNGNGRFDCDKLYYENIEKAWTFTAV